MPAAPFEMSISTAGSFYTLKSDNSNLILSGAKVLEMVVQPKKGIVNV